MTLVRLTYWLAVPLLACGLSGCGEDTPTSPGASAQQSATASPGTVAVSDERYKGCLIDQQTAAINAVGASPIVCADLETTGDSTVKVRQSTMVMGKSCAEWVQPRVKLGSSTPTFALDLDFSGPGDGKTTASVYLPGYEGPRVYSGSKVHEAMRMGSLVKVTTPDAAGGNDHRHFNMFDTSGTGIAQPAATVMDIRADGSGTLTWTGLNHRAADAEGVLNQVKLLDAKLTWRCIDPA